MRSDRNEELQRLEEALLETENVQEDMQQTVVFSPEAVVQQSYTVRNTDRVDVDMEEFSSQVQQPSSGAKSGVVALLVLLTIAFLGVIAWWLLRMKGLI